MLVSALICLTVENYQLTTCYHLIIVDMVCLW